jgi:chromosome segregation ATPase
MTNQLVSPALSCSFDETSPKKAFMIGEEYEALLQSALEEQALHYEGEITRLRAELTAENVDASAMTKEEMEIIDSLKADIARLRVEIDHVSRQLLDAQAQDAGYRAASQRLLREQSVAQGLLDKIQEEAARENIEGRTKMEELEQQVADLTANLRMRHQFSQDEELNNAQIFGTRSLSVNSSKRGKKLRRLFRK